MRLSRKVKALVAVNNAVSAKLAKQDLAARRIPLRSVALIALRDLSEPWFEECAVVLRYPGRPASRLIGQWRFLRFYRRALRIMQQVCGSGALRDVYLVNNDNLITTHLLLMAERDPRIHVTVVVEGLMNFQEIGVANRARWRWRAKPLLAKLLGFRYRQPKGHLSGAFEPRVDRVVSFAAEGLKAPPEKVIVRRFEPVRTERRGDPTVALIVLTGLNQWMADERFEPFAKAFVAWIERAGFRKVQVKKHPRVSAGLIEELLSGYEEIGGGQTTEDMASDLEAGVVLGACCTALVTLKLLRPDLECIDFGSDYYSEYAYHGDQSVKTLLSAAGVILEQMGAE